MKSHNSGDNKPYGRAMAVYNSIGCHRDIRPRQLVQGWRQSFEQAKWRVLLRFKVPSSSGKSYCKKILL